MPILPNENRSVLQSLEEAENIPTGLLQGLNEKMTGWRPNLNFLPDYMLPEQDRGENKTEQEVIAQDLTGAKMMRANLDMFGGNEALASHAFMFGPDKTEERINQGKFPQAEADSVFDVAKRKAGILGQEITPDDINAFARILGTKPSEKVIKQKQPPRPEPQKPVSLKRGDDGTYYTGDPLYDALLKLDSGDNKNPEENFLKLKRQVRNIDRSLTKAGVPVNPTTLYLAHQKSPKYAIKVWNDIQSDNTQSINNYKMAEQQVAEAMGVNIDEAGLDNNQQPQQQPQVEPLNAETETVEPQQPPTPDYAQLNENAYSPDTTPIQDAPTDSQQEESQVSIKDQDWGEIADRVFGRKKPSYESKTVSKAISGLLSGIVTQ